MNHDFVIFSDSTCEMNRELRERYSLEVLPAHIITPEGKDCLSDNDWILYPDPKEFYRQLSDKKLEFSTSPANAAEVKEYVKKCFEQGKDALFISLTSALSACYNFALMAKKELDAEYPDRKFLVVDSYRYSLAIGMLMIEASKKRAQGYSIEETAEYVESIKNTLHESGPMEDLFFLSRKGRVSKGAAFMGTLVGVKPMGDFDTQGRTTILTKAMGLKNALNYSIEYMKRTIVHPEEQTIFVAHTDREKNATLLAERIRSEVQPKEVIVVQCGPSIAINVGPGLYTAFYFGTPISEGCVEEQKIMNEITGK